jgi:hypothetical protein
MSRATNTTYDPDLKSMQFEEIAERLVKLYDGMSDREIGERLEEVMEVDEDGVSESGSMFNWDE